MAQDTEWHVSRQVKAGELVFKALVGWDLIDFMACNFFLDFKPLSFNFFSFMFPLSGPCFPDLCLSTCSLFQQVEVESSQQSGEEGCSEEFS